MVAAEIYAGCAANIVKAITSARANILIEHARVVAQRLQFIN